MPLILLLLLLAPDRIAAPKLGAALVVWNVGQGQWVSLVTPEDCFHFDLGGEYFPSASLRQHCSSRRNLALFSHWDWDHIRFAKRARQALPNLCILTQPAGHGSAKKKAFLRSVPACSQLTIKGDHFSEIYSGSLSQTEANEASRVFVILESFLNPGDSSKEREELWAKRLEKPQLVTHLMAGHHGSITSNGEHLLKSLPELKQVFVSARHRRYKHPHWKVRARFDQFGVALVRTENWGNLILPIEWHWSPK